MHFPNIHCIHTCIHLTRKNQNFNTFKMHSHMHKNNQKFKVFMHSYMYFHKNVDQNSPKLNSLKMKDPLDTRSEVKIRRPSRYKVSSEDTMILWIQDPGLMLIGAAC